MGVLKSIRKRNQGIARNWNSKKLLNYSSISNGSGNTAHDSSDDIDAEAFSPLFEIDIRTSSRLTQNSDPAVGPETPLSPLSLFEDLELEQPEQDQEQPKEPEPELEPEQSVDADVVAAAAQKQETAPTPTQKPMPEQKPPHVPQQKIMPVEPVAPLGEEFNPSGAALVNPLKVVLQEDEWDSISHISNISANNSSTEDLTTDLSAASRDWVDRKYGYDISNVLLAEDIQKDLANMMATQPVAPKKFRTPSKVQAMVQNFESGNTSPSPIKPVRLNVVSPGPEDKKDFVLNTSQEGSKVNSKASLEKVGFITNIVANDDGVSDASPIEVQQVDQGDRIIRILKRLDSKDGDGNSEDGEDEDESPAQISHVFEDDHESPVNARVIDHTAATTVTAIATLPLYSEDLVTPNLVSPEQTQARNDTNASGSHIFKAVFHNDFKEEQHERPAVQGALAPSFDGSAATQFTDNTTGIKSESATTCASTVHSTTKSTSTANTARSIFTDSVNKLPFHRPEFLDNPPAGCDSAFSSPTVLAERLKNSFRDIKKELGTLYEKSGQAVSTVEDSLELLKTSCFAPMDVTAEELAMSKSIDELVNDEQVSFESGSTVNTSHDSSTINKSHGSSSSSVVNNSQKSQEGVEIRDFITTATQASF